MHDYAGFLQIQSHYYMGVTHLIERKQIKAIHTITLNIQQKMEAIHYKFNKLEMKLHIQQTSLLTHYFVPD